MGQVLRGLDSSSEDIVAAATTTVHQSAPMWTNAKTMEDRTWAVWGTSQEWHLHPWEPSQGESRRGAHVIPTITRGRVTGHPRAHSNMSALTVGKGTQLECARTQHGRHPDRISTPSIEAEQDGHGRG